jgi:hypothetical protein
MNGVTPPPLYCPCDFAIQGILKAGTNQYNIEPKTVKYPYQKKMRTVDMAVPQSRAAESTSIEGFSISWRTENNIS